MDTETNNIEQLKDDMLEFCVECYLAGHDHVTNGLAPLRDEMLRKVISKRYKRYRDANDSSEGQGEARPFNARVSKPPTNAEAMDELEDLWNRIEQGEVRVTAIEKKGGNYAADGLTINYMEYK